MIAIEGKSQKIRGEIEVIRNHINLNQNKVKIAQEDIDRLRQHNAQIEQEQIECDQRLKYLGDEQSQKDRELQKVRENLNQMKSSHAEIRNRNNILTSLLRGQRDGVLAGIFGRLGDLGTIDQKYDCAVTTACGVLDHIVVDNI